MSIDTKAKYFDTELALFFTSQWLLNSASSRIVFSWNFPISIGRYRQLVESGVWWRGTRVKSKNCFHENSIARFRSRERL